MSSEENSIHDFDFTLICDYFSRMHRQGPGSREMTLKALSFINGLGPTAALPTWVAVQAHQPLIWRRIPLVISPVSTCFQSLSTSLMHGLRRLNCKTA